MLGSTVACRTICNSLNTQDLIITGIHVVLDNLSIFHEYHDISSDNISYREYFLISKYHIRTNIYRLYVS